MLDECVNIVFMWTWFRFKFAWLVFYEPSGSLPRTTSLPVECVQWWDSPAAGDGQWVWVCVFSGMATWCQSHCCWHKYHGSSGMSIQPVTTSAV